MQVHVQHGRLTNGPVYHTILVVIAGLHDPITRGKHNVTAPVLSTVLPAFAIAIKCRCLLIALA
jgi:hypothetical protein